MLLLASLHQPTCLNSLADHPASLLEVPHFHKEQAALVAMVNTVTPLAVADSPDHQAKTISDSNNRDSQATLAPTLPSQQAPDHSSPARHNPPEDSLVSSLQAATSNLGLSLLDLNKLARDLQELSRAASLPEVMVELLQLAPEVLVHPVLEPHSRVDSAENDLQVLAHLGCLLEAHLHSL